MGDPRRDDDERRRGDRRTCPAPARRHDGACRPPQQDHGGIDALGDPAPQVPRGGERRQRRRVLTDHLEILEQRPAVRALLGMRLNRRANRVGGIPLQVVRDCRREPVAIQWHVDAHRFSASRKRSRARWSCAFVAPDVTPSISAISSCLYPSTSCSVKTRRAPGGSFAIAASRSIRSPGARGLEGRASTPSPSSSSSKRERLRPSDFLAFRTTFTVIRWSQVPNALSPRKRCSFSHARTNTSCVSSSARVRSETIRAHREKTLVTCCRYSRSKACRSPAAASAPSGSATYDVGVGAVIGSSRATAVIGLLDLPLCTGWDTQTTRKV